MDLYNSMRPILDENLEQRKELWRLKEEDDLLDAKLNRVSVAVVGVPNAVRLSLVTICRAQCADSLPGTAVQANQLGLLEANLIVVLMVIR